MRYISLRRIVVHANAKIHILKQFTTTGHKECMSQLVVHANAKIHILKQFTTAFDEVVGGLSCTC